MTTLLYTGRTRTVNVHDVPTTYAVAGDTVTESRILPRWQDNLLTGPMFQIVTDRGWRFCATAADLAVRVPEPMMCSNCRDAVTWDASDNTWVGSDGEITCPESERPHGPVVSDEAETKA